MKRITVILFLGLAFIGFVLFSGIEPAKAQNGEGCTPGFWKNNLEEWVDTGFSPGDEFASLFGQDACALTLLDTLHLKGGKLNALCRHFVAAFLNAVSPGVNYPWTEAEVIQLFFDAFDSGDKEVIEDLKDQLDEDNNLDCLL